MPAQTIALLLGLELLANAGVVSAAFGSSSHVTDRCHTLLTQAQAEGHSHFEMAALCRARFPSNLCRHGLKRLGNQPWSSATMRSACSSWSTEWRTRAVGPAPARRTEELDEELIHAIDYTMDKKHELGICKTLSFEECLLYKVKAYPQILENVSHVLGEISTEASLQNKGDMFTPEPAAETPATTPFVAEWMDLDKALDFSRVQPSMPSSLTLVSFAAVLGTGALLVVRIQSRSGLMGASIRAAGGQPNFLE